MAIPFRQQDEVKIRIERFFWWIAIFYVLLVARLVYLQAISGSYYRDRAARIRDEHIPLKAQRGNILDRDGRPLAVTVHYSALVCDPTLVKNPTATAALLSGMLGSGQEEILPFVSPRLLKNNKPARNVVVCEKLTPEQAAAFKTARDGKKTREVVAGLNLVDHEERIYPNGRETAHVVGLMMIGKDGKPCGAMGTEQSFDTWLQGQDGYLKAEVDKRRRPIPDTQTVRNDPRDGVDVRLTLDSAIQHITEQELAKCVAQYQPDSATAIVLDPKTGDVLAMVSYPDFDPVNRKELAGPNEPGMNRALTPFEPGSTMKIFTVAAALQSHVITPSSSFYCGGHLKVHNKVINDAEHGKDGRAGHGEADIKHIIAESCNVCTAQIGMKLGLDRMEQGLNTFQLLDKTGIELTADQRGLLGPKPGGKLGDMIKVARVAFGQSVMVSPLALAAAYGAIANGGELIPPRLALGRQSATGKKVSLLPVRPGKRIMTSEMASYLRELLEEVVLTGTAKGKANIPGYTVAGKTGTAQKVVRGQRGYSGQHIASFIGFLPARNPRAVIYVIADNPKGPLYYGANVAGPVFKGIGQQLMWYWKVPPDDPTGLLKEKTAQR